MRKNDNILLFLHFLDPLRSLCFHFYLRSLYIRFLGDKTPVTIDCHCYTLISYHVFGKCPEFSCPCACFSGARRTFSIQKQIFRTFHGQKQTLRRHRQNPCCRRARQLRLERSPSSLQTGRWTDICLRNPEAEPRSSCPCSPVLQPEWLPP